MKSGRHFFFSCVGTVAMLALASSFTLAQGNGKGKGHGNNKHGDDDDAPAYSFSDHDRDVMRDWYRGHRDSLPPGLAKKDRLPPDWRSNSPNGARCLPACRSASNLSQWNWNGSCLLRHLTARTS